MKWEYRSEVVPLATHVEALKKIGSEGWELVNAFQGQAAESPLLPERAVPVLFCVFKKPLAVIAA